MYLRIFISLAELINGDLTAKIGQGILCCELIGRSSNCSNPSKVNVRCVYKDKFREIV